MSFWVNTNLIQYKHADRFLILYSRIAVFYDKLIAESCYMNCFKSHMLTQSMQKPDVDWWITAPNLGSNCHFILTNIFFRVSVPPGRVFFFWNEMFLFCLFVKIKSKIGQFSAFLLLKITTMWFPVKTTTVQSPLVNKQRFSLKNVDFELLLVGHK